MKFDLHVHTNHSDGIYSPEKVIDLAMKMNINGIAITDHDTISALQVAINYSRKFDNFKIIPGVEISSIYEGEEVHILGLYIDYKNTSIIDTTNNIKKSRIERGIKIVEKINKLGLKLDLKEVKKFAKKDFIGRPHIARALIHKGYVENMEEAFEKYLKLGAPAYVERYKITIEETVNLIKNAGGIPILAHPGLIKNKEIISHCVEKGILGLEGIHSKHTKKDVAFSIDFAKKNNLILTGGSDFHGDRGKGEILLGKYYVGTDTILQLEEMI